MKIKTPNNEQIARFLSGGNQQKIVLGKWLAMKPKLLMLTNQPGELTLGQREKFTNLWKSWRVREWLSCLFQRDGRDLGDGGPCLCDARRDYCRRTGQGSVK